MPFLNFENRHFADGEKTQILQTIAQLQSALEPKSANLEVAERQQYGSINEQNKLLVNKSKDYRQNQPNLSSPDVDWDEFDADFADRSFLESVINSLVEMVRGMENAKILHDWDNYQAALRDYSYTQYKNAAGAIGYNTKENEMKQFFPRNAGSGTPPQGGPTPTV